MHKFSFGSACAHWHHLSFFALLRHINGHISWFISTAIFFELFCSDLKNINGQNIFQLQSWKMWYFDGKKKITMKARNKKLDVQISKHPPCTSLKFTFNTSTGGSLLQKTDKKFVDKLWAGMCKSKLRDPLFSTYLNIYLIKRQQSFAKQSVF